MFGDGSSYGDEAAWTDGWIFPDGQCCSVQLESGGFICDLSELNSLRYVRDL
jgi:hypothetical protein